MTSFLKVVAVYFLLCYNIFYRSVRKLNKSSWCRRKGTENRETGERPVRSRHCMQECIVNDVTE